MIIQFMYKGEVKVADSDMQQFLSLGKMLQVKGLCSVELQDTQKTQKTTENKGTSPLNPQTRIENKKVTCNKVVQIEQKKEETTPVAKKRKCPSPEPPEIKVSFIFLKIGGFQTHNNEHQRIIKTFHQLIPRSHKPVEVKVTR